MKETAMKETALITIDAISSITAACKSFQGAATFLIVFFVGCGAAEQPPSALAPPEPEGADNSAKDLMTAAEPSAQDSPDENGRLWWPMPLMRGRMQFVATPVIAGIKTDMCSFVVGEENSSKAVPEAVRVVSDLLLAIRKSDGKRISELVVQGDGAVKDPARYVTSMLGSLESLSIERCFHVGQYAFVSVKGDVSRPSNGLIPVHFESNLVDLKAMGKEPGQFVSMLEFAIATDGQNFKGKTLAAYGKTGSLGTSFSQVADNAVPLYLANVVEFDSSGNSVPSASVIDRASQSYREAWALFAAGDYESFAQRLDKRSADYFERMRNRDDDFNLLRTFGNGKRLEKYGGELNGAVVLLVENDITDAVPGAKAVGIKTEVGVMFSNGPKGYLLTSLGVSDHLERIVASALGSDEQKGQP